MSEQATPSESIGYEHSSWWTISSESLMDMLYAVHYGESPEAVYVRAYNSSYRERPGTEG